MSAAQATSSALGSNSGEGSQTSGKSYRAQDSQLSERRYLHSSEGGGESAGCKTSLGSMWWNVVAG